MLFASPGAFAAADSPITISSVSGSFFSQPE
jgi:hypothetical protein